MSKYRIELYKFDGSLFRSVPFEGKEMDARGKAVDLAAEFGHPPRVVVVSEQTGDFVYELRGRE